ncbi:hypothetical protein F4780DRAFT_102362 [Xylariomycetidae sp. FL0641]|nr:hypothetical protein F4780DRAFT_102362 [Xylariomycetidae sp. FL0641]
MGVFALLGPGSGSGRCPLLPSLWAGLHPSSRLCCDPAMGYNTAEMKEIVHEMMNEAVENDLTQIPDIEILPNINPENAEDLRPKTLVKRKTSAVIAARATFTNALSLLAWSLEPTPCRWRAESCQPSYIRSDDSVRSSPVEKRQRLAEAPVYQTGTVVRWSSVCTPRRHHQEDRGSRERRRYCVLRSHL